MSRCTNNVASAPAWNILVQTTSLREYADLKNAMLYANRVYWFPVELILDIMPIVLRSQARISCLAQDLVAELCNFSGLNYVTHQSVDSSLVT